MIRLLLVLFFVFLVSVVGTILRNYDFPITAEFQDYLIETSAARLAIVFIILLAILLIIIRFFVWLRNSPKRLFEHMKSKSERQAYKDVMQGFSSLAAGDLARARKYADKASKALPDQALTELLQSQVAALAGEKNKADEYYKLLSNREESSFIGYRGLLSNAISNNQLDKALETADELLRKYPKSVWLNESLIDLGFRTSSWDKLERYLKKSEANKVLSKEELAEKFAIYYYMKAKIAESENRHEDAEWLVERSLKYMPEFTPSAIFQSQLYIKKNEFKKARNVIEDSWKDAPHPLLGSDYEKALQSLGEKSKAKKIRKLYEAAPDDVDSVLVYAKALLDEGDKDEARAVVKQGLNIRETKDLCTLMSEVDDKILWQNRSYTAKEDKCWYCKLTGARYQFWQPYSDSGKLGTIVWDFPPELPRTELANNNFLFLN